MCVFVLDSENFLNFFFENLKIFQSQFFQLLRMRRVYISHILTFIEVQIYKGPFIGRRRLCGGVVIIVVKSSGRKKNEYMNPSIRLFF